MKDDLQFVLGHKEGLRKGFFLAAVTILTPIFLAIILSEGLNYPAQTVKSSGMSKYGSEAPEVEVSLIFAVYSLESLCFIEESKPCAHLVNAQEYEKAILDIMRGREAYITFEEKNESFFFRYSEIEKKDRKEST